VTEAIIAHVRRQPAKPRQCQLISHKYAGPGAYGYSNDDPNGDASSHGDSSLAVVVRGEDAWVLEGTVYLRHMSVTMAASQGTRQTYRRPVSAVLLAGSHSDQSWIRQSYPWLLILCCRIEPMLVVMHAFRFLELHICELAGRGGLMHNYVSDGTSRMGPQTCTSRKHYWRIVWFSAPVHKENIPSVLNSSFSPIVRYGGIRLKRDVGAIR
jgi:hypothetical protein